MAAKLLPKRLSWRENPRFRSLALNPYVSLEMSARGQAVWGRQLVTLIFLSVEKSLLHFWSKADLTLPAFA